MQLKSIRVQNCFGFRDSGTVNLEDANNLICVVGRNSSGKSSLLRALKAFEAGVVPQDHPNFRNFNQDIDKALISTEFTTTTTTDSTFSFDNFKTAFTKMLASKNFDSNSIKTTPKLKTFEESVLQIYNDFVNNLNTLPVMRIEKLASGFYRFLSQHGYDKFNTRVQAVQQLLKAVPDNPNSGVIVAGGYRTFDIGFYEIERLLSLQLPRLLLFDEHYSLKDDLPPQITKSLLEEGKQNEMLKAFISVLGNDAVKEFLLSSDPDDREELLTQIRGKVNDLTQKINAHRSNLSNKDLLEIRLHENNGLQITVQTDGKKSFYSHLSDNTKFLFAYYLYKEVKGIQGNVLLFDEPNNGFHPTAQEFILNFLESIANDGNLVVVSTHSEHLINPDRLSGIRLMSVDVNSKSPIVKNYFYNQPKEKGDYLALQPILDAIGLRYGSLINIKDKVVITEGITDMLYLRTFNTILQHEGDLNIAPARGDSHISNLIPLFVSQGISFKIVIDEGGVKQAVQEAYGIADDFVFGVPVPAEFASMPGSGIEDLFTKQDFKNLLAKAGELPSEQFEYVSNSVYLKKNSFNLKRLVAHKVYEQAANYKQEDFEPETIENFRRVLDFCKSNNWFSI